MKLRHLGKSDIQVSEIGFGAWAIGGNDWGPVDDRESLAAMERAVELGANYLDTADVYGNGHSEELISELIRSRRDRLVISSKGGLMGHHRDPHGEPVYNTPQKVIAACEASLKRLGTDYIDLYFCHLWWDKPEETEAFLRAFEMLKRDGKIRLSGVSTEDLNYIKHFNQEGTLDAVQLDYSLLNRSVEQEVLPYLQEHGIGVVVRGPLRMGILTGKFTQATTFPPGDVRQSWPEKEWFKQSLVTTERLRELTSSERTLSQLALQFALAHPAVSALIPGAKTKAQVEQNLSAAELPPLTAQELAAIAQITLK